MSTEKMREEFENSRRFRGMNFARSTTHPEFYESPYANGAWDGWQASRASLVIELPPVRPEPIASGDELKSDGEAASWNIWVGEKLAKADCREAIEAAGLKVKP